MKPHKDDIIRAVLQRITVGNSLKAGLIISTRLVQSNGFDSTPAYPV